MSERNGDRARFQKNRKSKLRRRQRIQVLRTELRQKAEASRAADVQIPQVPSANVGNSDEPS